MEEEILVDSEVKAALDEHVLGWDGVSVGSLHGGVSYEVSGEAFAVLLEGVIAARLPDDLRSQALGLAGVSPFHSPDGDANEEDDGYAEWVRMVILLPDGVPDIVPWIQAAYEYTSGKTPGGQ